MTAIPWLKEFERQPIRAKMNVAFISIVAEGRVGSSLPSNKVPAMLQRQLWVTNRVPITMSGTSELPQLDAPLCAKRQSAEVGQLRTIV
jgi:hypothetical protein